jgi:haloalkane dehalogenase
VPKLLLTFDPGAIMTPPTITWCRDHIAALDVEHVGPGLHFVQEDNGPSIGIAIAAWRHRRGLAGPETPPLSALEHSRYRKR